MSRRYHKKSRNGCTNCKGRHMRCDQARPVCRNCGTAEIRCSFLPHDAPQIVVELPQIRSQLLTPASGSPMSIATKPPSLPVIAGLNQTADPYELNLSHLVLFNNLFNPDFLTAEAFGSPDTIPYDIYHRQAMSTPYLMHQILAISALHLSITIPARRGFYRGYATGLQARALSLFNECYPNLKLEVNHAFEIFLFSSSVVIHLLCETLYYERQNYDNFLDMFTSSLGIYRGVLAIVQEGRCVLSETELGPHLELARTYTLSDPVGAECSALRNMLLEIEVDTSMRTLYEETTLCLQQMFDAQKSGPDPEKTRVPVFTTWLITLSPAYVSLLQRQNPAALVILAHYAILLHRGSHLWLLGDAGRWLIEAIHANVPPEWHRWLAMPLSALASGSAS